MARAPIAIAQGFYVDESKAVAAQECINLFPHIPMTKTITDAALIGRSGIEIIESLIDFGAARGGHVMNGVPYFVSGRYVYKVEAPVPSDSQNYTVTLVGPSSFSIEGTGPVIMTDNGEQLVILAPDYDNQYNAWIAYSDHVDQIGVEGLFGPAFDGPASDVCFLDGYFVFSKKDSNKFFISDLRDGMAYNAADFASAESDPDDNVAIKPLNGLLYVFGSQTFEQWQDVGGTGFPFQKASIGGQQKGCASTRSLVYFDEMLVWIGSSYNEKPAVWATNGSNVVKLSTPAIDNLINSGGIDPIRNSYAIRWAERGHNFVAFTIPDVCTVVFDAMTHLWHTMQSVDDDQNTMPWRAAYVLNAYSTFFACDTITGRIGIFAEDIYMEFGNYIRRRFTAPAIDNEGNPFSVNALELFCDTGHVPISGQGSDPVIRLSISKDNGNTFSPEISRKLGKIGEYAAITNWSLLGRYRRPFIARFDFSEPVKVAFIKAAVEITS